MYKRQALGILYWIYQFNLTRQLEKGEAQQLKSINQLKTRFFTNITHEFRTPLTIILGMAAQREHPQAMPLIQRNSQKLLHLVNQLLDLSKLDIGAMKVQIVTGDIINYLRYITESFYSMAADKGIKISFYSEIPNLEMSFDEIKIQHIPILHMNSEHLLPSLWACLKI